MYLIKKFFYWFYPAQPKFCHTEEGKTLRRIMCWQVGLHTTAALISLAIIGFFSMISHMLWAMWTYSIYLSLREMQIIVYLVTLLAGVSFYFTMLFE